MLCHDCPGLALTEDQLTQIRRDHPGYAPRSTCCQTEGKLKEMEAMSFEDGLRAERDQLRMREAEMAASRPYSGPPRNRHERRAAAKGARA